MSDDYADDALPPDNTAGLANGMIILTTLILVVAVFAVWKITGDTYATGPLGP